MLYFAYGSNMSSARLRHRLPGIEPIGAAFLPDHRICFHKRGMDGSAKCNAFTGGEGIHGVLYRLAEGEKRLLDRIEGLGTGYRAAHVSIETTDKKEHQVLTYIATHIDGRLKPFGWYVRHVLVGAREWGLPNGYQSMLQSVGTISDPDRERSLRERGLYS